MAFLALFFGLSFHLRLCRRSGKSHNHRHQSINKEQWRDDSDRKLRFFKQLKRKRKKKLFLSSGVLFGEGSWRAGEAVAISINCRDGGRELISFTWRQAAQTGPKLFSGLFTRTTSSQQRVVERHPRSTREEMFSALFFCTMRDLLSDLFVRISLRLSRTNCKRSEPKSNWKHRAQSSKVGRNLRSIHVRIYSLSGSN